MNVYIILWLSFIRLDVDVIRCVSCRLRPRGSNVPWFICWFWHYINCLFVHLTSFLLSSYIILLFYLFTLWIGPFHFQTGSRRRRPNLAIDFAFILCCSILSWMHVCFCCVCFSCSVLSQEIGWEERLWNDIFCVGWNVNLNSGSVVGLDQWG